MWSFLFIFVWFLLQSQTLIAAEPNSIGVARVDITPNFPIRLSGYGNRRTEATEIGQRLWAKALAIGRGPQTALIITVDNCGVPAHVRNQIAQNLAQSDGLNPDRLALCSSHTHSAPMLSGALSNLFSQDIAPAEQSRIDQYTRELTSKIQEAAQAALANRQQARLAWTQGKTGFAKNRRTQGGPVDHSLPILAVTDANGKLRAVFANYACHCTTLTGEFNQIHGDWAGCAQAAIEREFPDAISLIAIGCGADSNPFPRSQLPLAQQHGQTLAAEAKRLLNSQLKPLPNQLECRARLVQLPFGPHFTREQWLERSRQPGIVGYHAAKNLARLDRGERLPDSLPYWIQTWNFGNDLALVFLPGEVVVDYSIRLKNELDRDRLWVNAYSNDVPCYIPSKRIVQEGGYEAETSLWYYDRPARLAPATEDLIVQTVRDLLPPGFLRNRHTPAPPPRL